MKICISFETYCTCRAPPATGAAGPERASSCSALGQALVSHVRGRGVDVEVRFIHPWKTRVVDERVVDPDLGELLRQAVELARLASVLPLGAIPFWLRKAACARSTWFNRARAVDGRLDTLDTSCCGGFAFLKYR